MPRLNIMCKQDANITFNRPLFTCGTLVAMAELMHPTMQRIYAAATAGKLIKGQYPQAELARKLNMTSQRVKNWESRGVAQQGAVAVQIKLGINASWIMSGQGERFTQLPDWAQSGGAVQPVETPPGYVRFQLLEGAGGMGAGVVNQDYPEVIRQVDMAEWEVRRKIGFLPQPGRIQLITGRGPSMRPRIDHGDVVMVDTTVTGFDGDATYVINVNGETQIKMLQMRGDGLYVVSANADYPAYKLQQGDALHVGGKVVATMGVREV